MKMAHVELAGGRRRFRAMGDAIDNHATHAANAFTAIMIEGDRLIAAGGQLLVEQVQHLQKGLVRANAIEGIIGHTTLSLAILLPPDA
jgi:hypothetical protein